MENIKIDPSKPVVSLAQNRNDEGMVEYLEQFRESLIESLMTITCNSIEFITKSCQTKQQAFDFLTPLENFIFNTCSDVQNPTIDYLRDCLFLLIDYCNTDDSGNFGYSLLGDSRFNDLLAMLGTNHKSYQSVEDLIVYANSFQKEVMGRKISN